ncbi:MAG: winged helix-turn-helix domain-containing protein [candidate division NC10 bacterium]|nr:winged helix-turn-helix domain-containing protein [candidate division NC10 bacterium]
MAIPDYQTCMMPLLRFASDGKQHQLKDAAQQLAQEFRLTEKEIHEFLPSGQQPVFINRIGWARTYLSKAGLLHSPKRGYFQITNRGLDILKGGTTEINTKYLEQFPEFQEFLAGRGEVHRQDRVVTVTVPGGSEADRTTDEKAIRESFHIQGLLARIGEQMGFSIWLPKRDRAGVLKEWKSADSVLLESLPLNYDDATIKTIEQIDVIWLKKRAIVRAFEVEHTTAVYSGILRMADLLALQPNMDINLHIVAPAARREKVFQEIQRPVFSLLDRAPLSECCTFISYDKLEQLAREKHLGHLSDSVLDEYIEEAE